LELSKPLKGAVLISPWVSFDHTTQGFKDNAQLDYLTDQALNRASKSFLGHAARHDDTYAEPALAPPEWWAELAGKACEQVMIWGGDAEILIDGIRTLAKNAEAGYKDAAGLDDASEGKVKVVEGAGEVHEHPIWVYSLKKQTGSYDGRPDPKGTAFMSMRDWICAKL
jgi:acetyl esterase/lipase